MEYVITAMLYFQHLRVKIEVKEEKIDINNILA